MPSGAPHRQMFGQSETSASPYTGTARHGNGAGLAAGIFARSGALPTQTFGPLETAAMRFTGTVHPGAGRCSTASRRVSRSPSGVRRTPLAKQHRPAVIPKQELEATLIRFSLGSARQLALSPWSGKARNEDQHIWGQVNRLFPLKLAVRWVAVAAQRYGDWPQLSEMAEQLESDAAMIGSALEQAGSGRVRKREEMLGTGLPRTGNLQSRDRYLSQFIARVTRSGHIYPGAITQYELASFQHDRLALSEQGVAIALLENPVLDGSLFTCTGTLSDDEKRFFIAHLSEAVPIERNDFRTVLGAVEQGNRTPESLLAATRHSFPGTWSDLEFRTHVYGVLGRLVELGLIGKEWEGRRVQYKLLDGAANIFAGRGIEQST